MKLFRILYQLIALGVEVFGPIFAIVFPVLVAMVAITILFGL